MAIGLILVPLWAAYIIEWRAPLWENIKAASRPKDNWGPKSVALKGEWEKFKVEKENRISGRGRLRGFLRTLFT